MKIIICDKCGERMYFDGSNEIPSFNMNGTIDHITVVEHYTCICGNTCSTIR